MQLISEQGDETTFEIIRLILVRRSREDNEYLLDYRIARQNYERTCNNREFVKNFDSDSYKFLETRISGFIELRDPPTILHNITREDANILIPCILKGYDTLPAYVASVILNILDTLDLTDEFLIEILPKTNGKPEFAGIELIFIFGNLYEHILSLINTERLERILKSLTLEKFLLAIVKCNHYYYDNEFLKRISLEFEEKIFSNIETLELFSLDVHIAAFYHGLMYRLARHDSRRKLIEGKIRKFEENIHNKMAILRSLIPTNSNKECIDTILSVYRTVLKLLSDSLE